MGLLKSFFPGMAGTRDANLGNDYNPPVDTPPFSDPKEVAADRKAYTDAYESRKAHHDAVRERENNEYLRQIAENTKKDN
jgi:hypothetical protein